MSHGGENMKTINNYPVKYAVMPRVITKVVNGEKINELDLWVPVTCVVVGTKIENNEELYEVVYLRDKNTLNKIDADFENVELVNYVSDNYEDVCLMCEEMNSFIFAKKSKDKKNSMVLMEIQNKLFEKCFESIEEEKVK